MKKAAVLAIAALSSCAPSLVSGNAAGGIVNANFNMGQAKAIEMADKECAKYGKIARVSGQNEIRNSVSYDCVTP